MVDFVNKLDFSNQIYQTNGTVRDENYKGELSFHMKEFVSFGEKMSVNICMSTIFLKDKIDGVRVPKFELSYISDTTHTLHFKNGLFVL